MLNTMKCVLLIDDDADDNFLHQLIIEDTGLNTKVVAVESGEEALQYLSNYQEDSYLKPDLILLDINMPRMDGFEFLNRYKTLPEEARVNTKIVMLSTSSHPYDQEKAEGIMEEVFYKTKPLTEDILEILL